MIEYNAIHIPPPKDRKIQIQIISDLGVCDLEWYEAYFDSSLGDNDDIDVYDDSGKCVGSVWFWRDFVKVD